MNRFYSLATAGRGGINSSSISAAIYHHSRKNILSFIRFESTKPSNPSPPSSSHYALFPKSFPHGPPPKGPFIIDSKQLKKEFLQLQGATHPDKAGSVDPNSDIRKEFEIKSSQLNIAYRSLLNPLQRAEHLLLIRGIDALSERDSLQDEDLLMDVLMAREAIAESSSREDLLSLQQDNDQRFKESEAILDRAFKEDDLETAKNETIKLSYWQNIKGQIDEALNA